MLTDNIGEPSPRIIFSHYVICNDTQQSIRFGQVRGLLSSSSLNTPVDTIDFIMIHNLIFHDKSLSFCGIGCAMFPSWCFGYSVPTFFTAHTLTTKTVLLHIDPFLCQFLILFL